ncbi:hypothetical protein IQ268_02435 [Oculatella sp. LEGE 06141]|uniref:hypothetical protein n=1 Tax=Oculatella sp. LEGE 06141 TaxID=1828648 RepID=UPI00187E0008|nr:hypothetical protein [Oculatella sp. LEGE 06141]MBE9177432.1 hypothetical protein [Oculatella sp. LEGE 06141]
MSSEPNTPETTAIVEVSSQTDALVETEMANESDEVRRETKALIEAIRKRAQVEVQTAGDYTRDAYLNAVRHARESIEHNQLFEPERIDRSVQLLQQEAEKNWHYVLSEIESLGTRLAEAAKAAWDTLMNSPNSK